MEKTIKTGTFKPVWRMSIGRNAITWVRLDPRTGKPDESTREVR